MGKVLLEVCCGSADDVIEDHKPLLTAGGGKYIMSST